MNKRAKHPLVEKKLGGKEGGGTTLTNHGEKEIEMYLSILRELSSFIQKINLD
jgi:molybdate transport system regulatory protein